MSDDDLSGKYITVPFGEGTIRLPVEPGWPSHEMEHTPMGFKIEGYESRGGYGPRRTKGQHKIGVPRGALERYRLRHDLTQEQLGRQMGISGNAVSAYETGRRIMPERIARVVEDAA